MLASNNIEVPATGFSSGIAANEHGRKEGNWLLYWVGIVIQGV